MLTALADSVIDRSTTNNHSKQPAMEEELIFRMQVMITLKNELDSNVANLFMANLLHK